MSYIKDLLEASAIIKSILIWLLLFPFWIISIYLFNPCFYEKADTLILFSFVLCFTILSNLIIEMTAYSMSKVNSLYQVDEDMPEDHDNEELEIIKTSAGVVTLNGIWLSILIFVFYSIKYFSNWIIDFYFFLLIKYLPIVILYILWEAKYYRRKKRYNRDIGN